DDKTVTIDGDLGAKGDEARRDTSDSIGLLVSELAGATDPGRAARLGRREAEHGDLIDGGRDVGRPELDGAQLGRPYDEVGARFARGWVDPLLGPALLDPRRPP